MKLHKDMKLLFMVFALCLSILAISYGADAAQKSRTDLQTDIDNAKLDFYSPHLMHSNLTNVNDSAFNKTTDTLADVPTGTAALNTGANVGTAGTGVTAVEYGDGFTHVTVLTLTAAALTPTIPADAEGAGVIIYTFPAGVYLGTSAHMDVTAVTADSATNAVDMGLGSLIASGDIVTLTTAAMEDWVTGQTVADISSPATEKSTVMTNGSPLLFESGDSHVLHLNMAGTWNNTVATLDATATITIHWTFLGS